MYDESYKSCIVAFSYLISIHKLEIDLECKAKGQLRYGVSSTFILYVAYFCLRFNFWTHTLFEKTVVIATYL